MSLTCKIDCGKSTRQKTWPLAPIEFQPELSAEPVEPVQQPEPTYESSLSTMDTRPVIRKAFELATQKRKAEMRDLSARLTVTRTFKGTKAKYLNFLSASVGSPSEASRLIDSVTTKIWFLTAGGPRPLFACVSGWVVRLWNHPHSYDIRRRLRLVTVAFNWGGF